ncbi:InlB B-repeat-containing protein, partial [Acetivibrio ethanolgignens]|uniref:InlB B-repeat-containing protein n=1 Tax=Acetivibrio ethanolgignens TaxID=290052 RepID=UPI0011CBD96C
MKRKRKRRRRIVSLLLSGAMLFSLCTPTVFAETPPMLLANDSPDEQSSLTTGNTYWFDLSGEDIPGEKNDSLPDKTLHWVPFTYAGTVNAYVLDKSSSGVTNASEAAASTTSPDEYGYTYDHSLFVADYAVTHTVSWDDLDEKNLIFGKDYASGGVDYTLRAPSVGSGWTGSGDSQRIVPQSNEWDTMLNKNSEYIQNWKKMYSWGQDTYYSDVLGSSNVSSRTLRGCDSARTCVHGLPSFRSASSVYLGFRPVLEVLNPDGLKVVTLDLGGGSSKDIHIIVKTGSTFAAPAFDGLGLPDGSWLGSNGKLYAPGDSVPADVTRLTAQFALSEQFSLIPGGRYYFDLSGADIPGDKNGKLPDKTLHWVPFTYAGTIEAYKLKSETATTEEYAKKNKYPHSLFVADYAVTYFVSWDTLNTANLIFGKNYASGGVDYTLRVPSVGSSSTGSGDSQRGVPQSNEWDTMLNKNSGYIQNWNEMHSWGQDTFSGGASVRATRGYDSARTWGYTSSLTQSVNPGFRPVLEVLNPDTLNSDTLKVVTLDLGGGKLGGSSKDIQIIVKNGSEFAAPASDGLTRPDRDTGSFFMWLGSNGKLYAPGDSVPADVTRLTAQFALSEQFSLTPGGRYYFDLSAMNIPGTANSDLPDSTLHYVPFTYAGTIEAYKLKSAMATTEEYAKKNKYPHSLFVADYNVTHTVSWNDLNTANLIFGKGYVAGGVDYTLRAPSVGSASTGSGDSERIVPQSNEWDTMLNKDDEYIQNWNEMYSWGQDTSSGDASLRALRGYDSARFWGHNYAAYSGPYVGFRPVLEVLNPDTLSPGDLKVVTLDLGGGKLGGSSKDIHIIVKNGSEFTAPASDGLTRPTGNTGTYFKWLGSNGKLYEPGAQVPANVTLLTARWEQFSPSPGGRYYFDLSAMNIPGTVNTGKEYGAVSLPDTTLHYVPFTYAGIVNAYVLDKSSSGVTNASEAAASTTSPDEYGYTYDHSLFVADYAVTHTVSWDDLNTANLIFGKKYASGGVDYTLRAPSVGSGSTGSDDSQRGTPQSNEWDTMLNKNSEYIQNWNKMNSWGQDTLEYDTVDDIVSGSRDTSRRTFRGYKSARRWSFEASLQRVDHLGFRPVLEVLNPDTLGLGDLKVVTLDLDGGKLGGSSKDIQIIVKTDSEFTAPASDGLTRPDGDTGSFFMWLGSDGKLYAPGDNVPADVTTLTVQWTAPTYTVTLNTNGGTIADGKDVTGYTYGVGATLPTDVTRTGYTFKGWYDNEGLTGSPVTAIGGAETGDKEYWAKWEAIYTGGSSSSGGGSSSGGSSSNDKENSTIGRPDKNNPNTPTTGQTTPVKPT